MSEMSPQPHYPPLDPDLDAESARSGSCPEAQRLRSMIDRLSQELASRQADPRPLPSSVMRAYQVLIDKYYAQLADLKPSKSA